MTVFDVQTMTDRMSSSMARQRFSTLMLGAFALFALLLAVVGVYGVMSHLVAQGSHDIGVRMAPGAERRNILAMVMRQGSPSRAASSDSSVRALTRVMASLLFGVSTTDLVTFSVVLRFCSAPRWWRATFALRATRVDPVVALRRIAARGHRMIFGDGCSRAWPTVAGRRRGRLRAFREHARRRAGRVLEIGAGTERTCRVSRCRDDHRRRARSAHGGKLAQRIRELGRPVELVTAPAERLPLPDGGFDTVVSTLVLCTVTDQSRALAEIRCVLKPGGQLLFLEHVRAEEPKLAAWQDRLNGLNRFMLCGCNCNRSTAEAIRDAGFTITSLKRDARPAPPFIRPMIGMVVRDARRVCGRPAPSRLRSASPPAAGPSARRVPIRASRTSTHGDVVPFR